MSTSLEGISKTDTNSLEQIVVTMYCNTFDGYKVNHARRYMLAKKGKAIENVPPTSASLKEHIKRSALQSRKWFNCLDCMRVDQDPVDWGWIKEEHNFLPDGSLYQNFPMSPKC